MKILLDEKLLKSSDNYDTIMGVVDFVNAMLESLYRPEELPREAFEVYYVDYYLAQINNGGVSQFVHNSKWSTEVINHLRSGLEKMGANQHLRFFDRIATEVELLGSKLWEYLNGDYYMDNENIRDGLNRLNEEFFKTESAEPLVELNVKFVRALPCLQVLPHDDYKAEIHRLSESVPNKVERKAEAEQLARSNEPSEIPVLRVLCANAGLHFEEVNGVGYTEYKGQTVHQWHIVTSGGHRSVIFADSKAILTDDRNRMIAELDI